jgi:tetratricopeptide (TPR) repeat protein
MGSRDVVLSLIESQEVDKALDFVSKLPESEAETWYLKGKVYSRKGDMKGALSCFNKAVAIDPKHEEAAVMIEISTSIYSFKDPNLFNH